MWWEYSQVMLLSQGLENERQTWQKDARNLQEQAIPLLKFHASVSYTNLLLSQEVFNSSEA